MWNNMKKKFFAICGLCILVISCSDEAADIGTDPSQRIYLRATVENGIVMSRSPFSLSNPGEENPLEVAVWASTTQGEFKDLGEKGSSGVVALHTMAHFSNGSEQYLNDAVYPGNGTPVYFVGLHPATETEPGWTTDAAGAIARKTFDGSEDVMFAPQISGVYGGNVDTWPTFRFNHLLTWLRVKIKAESEAVSESWGKLKSLKVKCSKGNIVEIDLKKYDSDYYNPDDTNTPDAALENCVSFSDGEGVTLDFYETGTDNVYLDGTDQTTWQTLPYDNYEEVAYVLCAPVVATALNIDGVTTTEYTLIVETERRRIEVPVDLMNDASSCFEGSTMNHQFTLDLNFKMGNNIFITAFVSNWAPGGISHGDIEP